MQSKVVVMLVVNDRVIWRSEASMYPKFARRMTDKELADIGKNTAEFVETVAGMKPEQPAAIEAPERKKKR